MRLTIEYLEARRLMIAEGSSFSVNSVLDTSGVVGTISAQAIWGDGSQTPLTVSEAPARGPLTVRFDYTYDTSGFFNAPERRQVLQAAADIVFAKFTDQLTAISPSGNNRWTASFPHPSTGASVSIENMAINANEIVVFPGARDLPGNDAALGGPGGTAWRGTSAWGQTVTGRGQAGANSASPTDFGPWGGSIVVDPTLKWHFGTTTEGLENGEFDFLTAVSHEFVHLLGFGVAPSWTRLVSGGTFTGAASVGQYGSAPPLSGDQAHWREGLASVGQETLMDPSINATGIRKLPTPLDLAGLFDIGWSVTTQTIRATGSKTFGDDGLFPVQINVIGSQAGSRLFSIQNVSVENVAPSLVQQADQFASAGSPFQLVDLGVFQDPGFGPTESFSYEIDWGDGSPPTQASPTIDVAGSPGVPTRGSFDGGHTYALPGTYRVRYRITDDNQGTDEKSFTVQVAGPPKVRLSSNVAEVSESAGSNAFQLTVYVEGTDNRQDIVVQLTNSDPSELVVPASVRIPAGQTQATIGISAVDDALGDGTQLVELRASFGGTSSEPLIVRVADFEQLTFSLNVTSTREDAGPGAAVIRLTRPDVDQPTSLTVNLYSSNPSAATVPATVVLPPGAGFVDVSVTAVDDSLLDGTQVVQLVVFADGYLANSASLSVEDFEPLQWAQPTLALNESIGSNGQTILLSLPAPATGNGTLVSLQADPSGQLIVPPQVTIPAGQQTIEITLGATDDTLVEGVVPITLTAIASGYVAASLPILLTDNDTSIWTNSNNVYDVDGSGTIDPLDILLLINYLRRSGSGDLPLTRDPLGPPFVDVNGDGQISPVDILQVINAIRRRTV